VWNFHLSGCMIGLPDCGLLVEHAVNGRVLEVGCFCLILKIAVFWPGSPFLWWDTHELRGWYTGILDVLDYNTTG